MDYIRQFDIKLEKEMYYAGELLSGVVKLDTIENFKLRAIRVNLRGKAHTEWKVIISGDRRTVKDDQYFIDDRSVIWGKEKAEGSVPILPRGTHQFPFRFQLPETSLPCSFESKCGTIRYYLKVTIDIPYASPPEGIKYFTIIGPHIDCMDDNYLKPIKGECKRKICCLCCERRVVSLCTQLDRSAYCCGESLRVKADIDNQSEEEARLKLKLVQHVEYFIDKGVLGAEKEEVSTILEFRSAPVTPHTRTKWDSQHSLVVSTMPPTLVGICRLIQIYYVLKAHLEFEKSGEDLHMNFPITVGTVPFRIPNSKQKPKLQYEVASEHTIGGNFLAVEFQLGGQVYDGSELGESIVLYRPVYITVLAAGAVPSSTSSSSIKSKSQRNSVQKASSSSGGSGTRSSQTKKVEGSSREQKLNRSSTKTGKIQKLNSLSVAPPSLQSIAKKRSSLPDNTKTHTFVDFSIPLTKFGESFSAGRKDQKDVKSSDNGSDHDKSKTKTKETKVVAAAAGSGDSTSKSPEHKHKVSFSPKEPQDDGSKSEVQSTSNDQKPPPDTSS